MRVYEVRTIWSITAFCQFGVATEFCLERVAHLIRLTLTGLNIRAAAVPRFARTFYDVGFPIDHLKVWQTPKPKQLWPRKIAVFGPNAKQREPVINFGIPPESSTSFAAATRLESAQQLRLTTRCIPELPRNHTGAVPDRIFVGAVIPKIHMPAKTIHRLTTHTAETRALAVYWFAIRRWWRSKGRW